MRRCWRQKGRALPGRRVQGGAVRAGAAAVGGNVKQSRLFSPRMRQGILFIPEGTGSEPSYQGGAVCGEKDVSLMLSGRVNHRMWAEQRGERERWQGGPQTGAPRTHPCVCVYVRLCALVCVCLCVQRSPGLGAGGWGVESTRGGTRSSLFSGKGDL